MITNLPFQQEYEAYRAMWDKINPQIDENIEKYRKADFQVNVVNKNGEAIPEAKVTVHQLDHDFVFGCNGLMVGDLGDGEMDYQDSFGRLFNLVTTTMCWAVTEFEPDKFRFEDGVLDIFRRPPIDRIIKFAEKYNLKLKGQPLLCDRWCPDWASKDPEELKKQIVNYFKKVSAHCGEKFDILDVVNEAWCAPRRSPDFPLLDEEFSFIDWAFESIRGIFPEKVDLELNEANHAHNTYREAYYNKVKSLMDQNLPIKSVGLQYHLFSPQAGMEHMRDGKMGLTQMLETYEKFNQLGLPMYISEVTIPSTFEGTKAQGEALQAEIARNMYRLWFSVENMAGIIYWNFKDGLAWKNEGDCLGCLMDENFKEKPSYFALYNLIKREWMTNEKCMADEKGAVQIRGFKGEYLVEVEKDGAVAQGRIHVGKDNAITITL
ncbi:MAG: endo-1,4-beta-xylanase [Clostridia bacterium]|nr:endo-1,4-beta-xylanase [Clostridia bacterium]